MCLRENVICMGTVSMNVAKFLVIICVSTGIYVAIYIVYIALLKTQLQPCIRYS